MKSSPGINRAKFIYNLSRASYEKEWDVKYQKPGIGARILGFFIRILPKVGPLKVLSFKPPTPETAKWFEDSFDKTMDVYRGLLVEVGNAQLQLANMNFDTGQPTRPATYKLADNAYAKLAIKLAGRDNAAGVDPKMAADIVAYFRDPDLPFATKRDPKEWSQTIEAVAKLKSSAAGPANGPALR